MQRIFLKALTFQSKFLNWVNFHREQNILELYKKILLQFTNHWTILLFSISKNAPKWTGFENYSNIFKAKEDKNYFVPINRHLI